jgi:maltooligosyltrehalose trehalohydrolase
MKPTLGATVRHDGAEFGVWAPKASRVEVEIESPSGPVHHRLARDEDGIHAGFVAGIGAGARYRFRLDGGDAFPDPRSRFQPDGVHGPSEIIDPHDFIWTDREWNGITREGLVIYELHVGTYTPEGTFAALEGQLTAIKSLGVTAIQLMPVAEFPGRWNWGYDGVDWFAPSRAYGRPDDLRRLVNAAHEIGLAVILDVVYNHFGPDGNYLRQFSDDYFTDRHITPWGEAINYDGPNARFVRNLVLDNVRSWIAEYHLDGLRLDATDSIVDDSSSHLLEEIQLAARGASDRDVVVIAEDARNEVAIIREVARGGYGLDSVYADDFHHDLRVYLTNSRENYYAMFDGALDEVATAIDEGFIYQGQIAPTTGEPRGTRVTDEPASAFVFCIQNHDQIGNRPFGDRIHHEIGRRRFAVVSALLLLSPETPLLFMGQEFAASTPFLFFTDHEGELGRLVTEGRRLEFGGFRVFNDERHREYVPDPQAEATFFESKLNLAERDENAGTYALYRALLHERRHDPVLKLNDRARTHAEAVGINAIAVHRWVGERRRLLIANFGHTLTVPLGDLADRTWTRVLSTTEPRFGGSGQPIEIGPSSITIPARSAALFAAH